jgi:hypothetical protein
MWNNVGIPLIISLFVGYVAFNIICPKKKRGAIANRITVVIALLAYSLTVLAAIFMPRHEFSLKLFLLEGVLVGTITMGIIYGIAETIHWAITGKSMAWSELWDLIDSIGKKKIL